MIIFTPRRIAGFAGILVVVAAVYSVPHVVAWNPGPRAGFWVLVVTASAALWYGWLTYLLLRRSQTPVLVASFEDGRTVIRNFGAGAALNVTCVTDTGSTIARTPDLAPNASHNVNAAIRWTVTESRYLFYQDVIGRWHGTKCLGQGITNAANIPVANVFLGRVFNPPSDARRAALARSAVEHWVQLNRPWDPRNWFRRIAYRVRKRRAETRILKLIRAAIADGRLGSSFSPNEVATAIELDKVVADRFLPNHVVGNAGGERALFIQEWSGRYRLK